MGRYDLQIGNKDHAFLSIWHQAAAVKYFSTLPQPIASETLLDPQNSWVSRFNYDRVFSSTLLNHMSMGYLNRNEGYGCVNTQFSGDFPKIAGVASSDLAPQYQFSDGFAHSGAMRASRTPTSRRGQRSSSTTW